MQVVFEDEDEGSSTRRTNPVDFVICTRKVGGYLEEKCIGRFGRRNIGIRDSEGMFCGYKKGIQRRG